jgi:hypothetical protein
MAKPKGDQKEKLYSNIQWSRELKRAVWDRIHYFKKDQRKHIGI